MQARVCSGMDFHRTFWVDEHGQDEDARVDADQSGVDGRLVSDGGSENVPCRPCHLHCSESSQAARLYVHERERLLVCVCLQVLA